MINRNRTAQGTQGGGDAAGGGKKKMSPRAGYENWKNYKKANVERDDVDIISRSTLDTSEYVSLLNLHDRLLHKLRMNMGRKKNLTMAAVGSFLERSDAIKQQINLLNAEGYQLLGKEYRPPRGFENPLAAAKGRDRSEGAMKEKATSLKKSGEILP
jgi:hypothetical protein